jgi:threonyl-tRNA synthetase
MDIAKLISNSLANRLVIAKVDGVLFDTTRPLEKDCSLELLDFDSHDGKQVFWHSSAHVLGEACELHYGCHLCFGPPTDEGFYYDMGKMEKAATQADFGNLNTVSKNIIDQKQDFQRLELPKAVLLEMFKVIYTCYHYLV